MDKKELSRIFHKHGSGCEICGSSIEALNEEDFFNAIKEYEDIKNKEVKQDWHECSEEKPQFKEGESRLVFIINDKDLVCVGFYDKERDSWGNYFSFSTIINPYKWRYIDKPEEDNE